jgi:tRNA dimethylallyltransferase
MRCDAVLIAGPTASGKSALALALGMRISGTVINADSMQVYREAPILTAQPDGEARAKVPHLLYGHVPAREAYSVGRFIEDARNALDQARGNGRIPIFVGGTGLYFTALADGLADIPPIPSPVRAKARALLAEIGAAELHARLGARDPQTAAQLRPSDPQRVVRAWEVWEATGRPLAQWQKQTRAPVLQGLRLARFVLDPPRPLLRDAIARRFEAMLDQGGLQEALALKSLDPGLPAAKLLGLRPLIALAEHTLSPEEAIDQAVTATRQFAKRQMTWFRRHGNCDWIELKPGNSFEKLLNCLSSKKCRE